VVEHLSGIKLRFEKGKKLPLFSNYITFYIEITEWFVFDINIRV
jgi:hypothetical protein